MIILRELGESVAFVPIVEEDDGEVRDDDVAVGADVMVDELEAVGSGRCTSSSSPLNNFVTFTQLFWN
jgi:hypothetical protein